MKTERRAVGWSFWLAWVLASIMGFGIGMLLGASIAYGLFNREVFDATMGITLGLVTGAIGGFAQWLVLRDHIPGAGWWVVASALGFAAFMGTPATVATENPAMAGIMGAIALGFVGGIPQWIILRRHVERAGWWLVATLFGALVGEIGFPISFAIDATGNLSVIVVGVLFGVGLGAIPGAMLVWLLRQSQSSDTSGRWIDNAI